MAIKVSKADQKAIIAQAKQMIINSDIELKLSKEAKRKANINKTSALAIIKFLGGK